MIRASLDVRAADAHSCDSVRSPSGPRRCAGGCLDSDAGTCGRPTDSEGSVSR